MREQLDSILRTADVQLTENQFDKLQAFHHSLQAWNERMDLTNVPPEEMASRHYADSILPLFIGPWFADAQRIIDVGTGAGFPGMPLAICLPQVQFCLLDSLRKRCDFLIAVVEELGLNNVEVRHARAEDAAHAELRNGFDLALSRAVAPLPVLLEYVIPFVRVGGKALCWKGPAIFDEAKTASWALVVLKARAEEPVKLPMKDQEHYVLPVTKVGDTPMAYPRKAGTPSKKPL